MATKAQQRKFLQSADERQQAIVKILRDLSRTHGLDRTWSDWTEMGALALANAVDRAQFDKREARYLEIVGRYAQAELRRLVEAFALLVQCWDERAATGDFGDMLGSTFMMLDMGNAGTGQYFTPYEVSRLMAGMIMGDGKQLANRVEQQGFLRLMEPACGSGGMIISAVHALHDAGVNYQQTMHVTAIDIDRRCVHMTYLQLALLHVPAIVVHGNALTGEEWESWATPADVLGGWAGRLRWCDAADAMRDLLAAPPALPALSARAPEQTDSSSTPAVLSKAARRAAAAGQMSLF
ncbi:SAM-dependent methyltransferase [Achromobacter mucicolens]|uniref:N-6 DNA methylase n=1 Tax=Achromobacter mucicolens TaxID=1389922 RepID=UPI002449DDC7|nr:N-6 DNA methylase [Achromobacter mucicolens]MDH0093447.1 SAM-dependent methyltransferase [Achromobacter mucicolens]